MKVWITRDSDGACDNFVCLWRGSEAPVKQSDGYYNCPVTSRTCKMIAEFEDCEPSDFNRQFGFTPRKGSCKQYELTLKEVK